MKEFKQLGAYGLVIKDGKILLIKKFRGPYDGKLDLPGGTIEFQDRPEDALKREFLEETGINIKEYTLFDSDSVCLSWIHNNQQIRTHHIGIFYLIKEYTNEIKNDIKIDSKNDDSLGADFYEIDKLKKEKLSDIAILELSKLGYKLK